MPTNEAIYGFSPNVLASTVGEDYVVEIMREYLNTVNVLLNFPQPTPQEHESELILCLHTIKSASLMVGASKAGKWAASLEKNAYCLQDSQVGSVERAEWEQDLDNFKAYLASNVEKINQYLLHQDAP
ncbi:Hpt domain-containing protein [Vibrio xiamenensis]|uniref:Hpt domain-containing protein n=1 Tax=Vibrio xiamenensis TaxID=861298 RepID=A0A1G8ANV6_9VIBR|nr:Hpt domain-containing protein [Vibrio xiamenensis]SDH22681.1 Hpt domain-containing protein [Vibrio xiamenensis]